MKSIVERRPLGKAKIGRMACGFDNGNIGGLPTSVVLVVVRS